MFVLLPLVPPAWPLFELKHIQDGYLGHYFAPSPKPLRGIGPKGPPEGGPQAQGLRYWPVREAAPGGHRLYKKG